MSNKSINPYTEKM